MKTSIRFTRRRAVVLTTSVVMLLAAGGAIGGVLATRSSSPQPGTYADLKTRVNALDRARQSTDDAPPGFADRLRSAGASEDEVRSAMKVADIDGLGPIYIAPADGGFVVVTKESGGRVGGTLGPNNPSVGGLEETEGQPPRVWGVVIDDVVGLDVVVNDQSYPAKIEDNAFLWTGPQELAGNVKSFHVVMHLKDGSSVTG